MASDLSFGIDQRDITVGGGMGKRDLVHLSGLEGERERMQRLRLLGLRIEVRRSKLC